MNKLVGRIRYHNSVLTELEKKLAQFPIETKNYVETLNVDRYISTKTKSYNKDQKIQRKQPKIQEVPTLKKKTVSFAQGTEQKERLTCPFCPNSYTSSYSLRFHIEDCHLENSDTNLLNQ